MGNKRRIRITKLGQKLLLETKNKARKLVSTKHAVTSVLSSVTTDSSEKCIKASYKVPKLNTKKETPFRIENVIEYSVFVVVKVFCLFFQ